MENFLKPKDIKNILGCSERKMYDIIKKKSFPKIKIGKQYYIPDDAFREWSRTYLYGEYRI